MNRNQFVEYIFHVSKKTMNIKETTVSLLLQTNMKNDSVIDLTNDKEEEIENLLSVGFAIVLLLSRVVHHLMILILQLRF